MKVEFDAESNMAYIYLTDEPLEPGRTTVVTDSNVALDFKDGRLVGIEVFQASEHLHKDLLAHADYPGVA